MSTQTVMPIIHRYSMLAKRVRKWEPWTEPQDELYRERDFECGRNGDRACYCGLSVRVVQAMNQLALVEWQGKRLLVETADLEVRG